MVDIASLPSGRARLDAIYATRTPKEALLHYRERALNWANRGYDPGSMLKGATQMGGVMAHVSGFNYATETLAHGASQMELGLARAKVLPSRWFRRAGRSYTQAIHPYAAFGKAQKATVAGSMFSSLKILTIQGLLGPGLILGAASMSPHGFGIGLAEETAGFAVGTAAFSPSIEIGRLAGSRAAGLFTASETLTGLGGLVGAGVGLVAGFAVWEAARWTAGFALHTMPTFARHFQAELDKQGFGGDYTDSQGAATMRGRSLQVMGKSFANARSALGQEASLLHV